MTWHLDRPIRLGHRVFAAVTEVDISTHSVGTVLMATAHKRPDIILMMIDGEITALNLDGRVLTPKETARQYREAVAQLGTLQSTPYDEAPDGTDLDQ